MHTLPELGFSKDALTPVISAETIDYHYGKHHATYVQKLNTLLEGTGLENMPIDELLTKGMKQAPEEKRKAIFNNAAQVWNHTFYWRGIVPGGAKTPTGALEKAITATFGGFTEFKEKFTNAAVNHFGSGWAWLVKNTTGALEIVTTANAGTPLTEGKTALLTCDVWEHAYYIDYRNARPKYVEAYWNIVNWDVAGKNFG